MSSLCVWDGSAQRLWSLWEIMNSYDVPGLCCSIRDLSHYEMLGLMRNRKGEGEELVAEVPTEQLRTLYEKCLAQCVAAELEISAERLKDQFFSFLYMQGPIDWNGVNAHTRTLLELIRSELGTRSFCFIAKSKAKIVFEMPESWKAIWGRFPSTKPDTEEAVYCYALERNTASIFHLMRVAEFGLRGLARHARIKLPKRKLLEWAQWQEVLKQIRLKVDDINLKAKAGPAKDDLLDFYSGSLGQFYAFKDEYRNQVMHTRGTYDEFKAAGALHHVHGFMARLSARIDEKGKRVR